MSEYDKRWFRIRRHPKRVERRLQTMSLSSSSSVRDNRGAFDRCRRRPSQDNGKAAADVTCARLE